MPTFRVPIQCQYCSHRFVALIQANADDPPSTQYTVGCPQHDMPCVVYRSELTQEFHTQFETTEMPARGWLVLHSESMDKVNDPAVGGVEK